MHSSRKDKDSTRAERKAKKRKLEDAIPEIPGDDTFDVDLVVADESSKKRKHGEEDNEDNATKLERKKARKEEKKKEEAGESEKGEEEKSKKVKRSNEDTAVASREEDKLHEPVVEAVPKRSKKERKAEKKAAEAAGRAQKSLAAQNGDQESGKVTADGGIEEADVEAAKSKKNNRNREKKRKAANGEVDGTAENAETKSARFVVFIGNLPFSATTESIQKHFAAVKPKSVRHLTKKEDPAKSRGCAFVEFEGYDHMKTCLKLFHHSTFDDGISPPRKINVELTAGGGGNTKVRLAKIGEKNQKLNEQRTRRMQEEEKARLVKKEAAIDHNDVHPSRRARVPDIS